ncbi:hypothetical protein PHISP_03679 [Aspergillus sp. HF37]|nr:hypothetical protein PHISP_03679 [Aspergillus sp. HF37]
MSSRLFEKDVVKGHRGHDDGNCSRGTLLQLTDEFSLMACSRRTPVPVPFWSAVTKKFGLLTALVQ